MAMAICGFGGGVPMGTPKPIGGGPICCICCGYIGGGLLDGETAMCGLMLGGPCSGLTEDAPAGLTML